MTVYYINIVTWNVQGLVKDTIDNTMFLSCVNNNDVMILTETWLQGEIQVVKSTELVLLKLNKIFVGFEKDVFFGCIIYSPNIIFNIL